MDTDATEEYFRLFFEAYRGVPIGFSNHFISRALYVFRCFCEARWSGVKHEAAYRWGEFAKNIFGVVFFNRFQKKSIGDKNERDHEEVSPFLSGTFQRFSAVLTVWKELFTVLVSGKEQRVNSCQKKALHLYCLCRSLGDFLSQNDSGVAQR